MSLQYRSVEAYLVPWIDIEEAAKLVITDNLERINFLGSDQKQMDNWDIYKVLFSKILRATITVARSESLGIYIQLSYSMDSDMSMDLIFNRKKSKKIELIVTMRHTNETDYIEPSGMLQKLLINRLPKDIANVLMYFIYPPYIHDYLELEKYVGPILLDEDVYGLKTRTNYPSGWVLNNKWNIVSNFAFSMIEVTNHAMYDGDLEYPITIMLNFCKNMCRANEEAIVINKKFKRSG